VKKSHVARSEHGKKKRFLTYEEMVHGAMRIMEFAAKEKKRVALAGGFAGQLLGSTRLTTDIDVISEKPIRALAQGKALTFGGYMSDVDGIPVDVILRDDVYEALYEEALDTAKRFRNDELDVRMVQPEYLAVMKMVAGRGKDMGDLEYLVGERGIDMKKTEKIIRKHLGPYAALEDWPQLVREIEWRRGKK